MVITTAPFAPLDVAVTVSDPVAGPAVKVTEAVPVPPPVLALSADKVPAVPVREKVTRVPLGTGTPPVVTVAVTTEAPFTPTVVGDATTFTVAGGAALMTIATVPFAPPTVAVTVSVPSVVPVKVTEAVPVPPVVMAVDADKVPKPLVREKVTTMPLATGSPPMVTVAVTTEVPLTATVVGDATTFTVVTPLPPPVPPAGGGLLPSVPQPAVRNRSTPIPNSARGDVSIDLIIVN
jgi:hypothetical protein